MGFRQRGSEADRRRVGLRGWVALLAFCGVLQGPDRCDGVEAGDIADVWNWDLAELTQTSVSRKEDTVLDTAAAVYVITQEDIRRSGALSIPDVLRMVPGVEVAQARDNDWYVTIRGFNGEIENKLLVLIDGRSIYSPVFSGVFWYEQDLVLEDIERIEVIRGPGAAVWGANAVNGVINIITKSAVNRQGGLISAGGGTYDRVFGSARYGVPVGENGFGAAWVKAFSIDSLDPDRNRSQMSFRGWESVLAGFRYDWDPPTPERLYIDAMWHGYETDDTYEVQHLVEPYKERVVYRRRGSLYHLLGKYTRQFGLETEGAVQVYVGGNDNDYGNANLRYHTLDFDSQFRFPAGRFQDVVCGIGYRLVTDDLETRPDVGGTFFDPHEANRNLYSCFVEDEITVIPRRLRLTVGSKFEYNDYTGWEIQPNVRFLAKPSKKQSLWGAISRAVRTPSRIDANAYGKVTVLPQTFPPALNPDGVPGRLDIVGYDLSSEELTAYELGWRLQCRPRCWISAALYYNDYENLKAYGDVSGGFQPADDPPRLERDLAVNHGKEGYTYGAEASSTWQPLSAWRLIGAYDYFELHQELDPGSVDLPISLLEGKSPRHQFSLQSQWDVTRRLECDLWVRYVDELKSVDVDAYTTFDLRVAWKPRDDIELSLVGRNLAEEWHKEFQDYQVERSVYAKLSWIF